MTLGLENLGFQDATEEFFRYPGCSGLRLVECRGRDRQDHRFNSGKAKEP